VEEIDVRELVIIEYVSLDGVVQAPGHAGEDRSDGFQHGGWTGGFMDEHHRYMSAAFQAAGAVLLGRLTYEIFASYWPTVTDEGDEIAHALNTLPKYVVSTTLTDPKWKPTTVLPRDIAGEVNKLQKDAGYDIVVVGSAGLAQTLMHHDLVDRYQLWVHPIVLGPGKRLFRDTGPTKELRLVDSKTTTNGLVILNYEASKPARTHATA
jgi:dihydrofolate reductase